VATFGEISLLFPPENFNKSNASYRIAPRSFSFFFDFSPTGFLPSGQNVSVFGVAVKCEIMIYRYLDRV
jgi:hypothetical protein